jgi:hypothetical protein
MEEITIIPFKPLPEQSPDKVQKICVKIGDGVKTKFKFILPFAIIVSWRLLTCLDEVVEPDCLLRGKELILHFGRPPLLNEFTFEILGIL